MRLLVPLIVIISLFSCSSDLDFNQVDNIELTQNAVITGIYFQADQTKFLNISGSTEINEVSIISTFDLFKGDYIRDKLVKVVFDFELENTFNRNFEIEVVFLDESNLQTQTISLPVFQNANNFSVVVFEGSDLESLKTSVFVNLKAKLLPGIGMIDIDIDQLLTLKSTAKFTLISS